MTTSMTFNKQEIDLILKYGLQSYFQLNSIPFSVQSFELDCWVDKGDRPGDSEQIIVSLKVEAVTKSSTRG